MKGSILALLASQSVVTTEAYWGFRGHEATGFIAEFFLNEQAREASEFLLGGPGGLVRESTWADGYRNDPVYGWTGALHYFNTPDWACGYNHTRDCSGNECATGAVEDLALLQDTNLMQGRSIPKVDALKFLIHYVQDVHQPMHGAFASDLGGNRVANLQFNGGVWNLHSLWDTGMLIKRVSDDFGGSYDNYASYLLNQAQPPNSMQSPRDYSDDTARLACEFAYTDVDGSIIREGDTISTAYYERGIPIVEQRLIASGEQLAAVLNANLRLSGNEQPPSSDSCAARGCGDFASGANCQCNSSCQNFGDCCPDYFSLC